MSIEEKLSELGISLPPAPQPVGVYKPVVISRNRAFISGQISKDSTGKILTGKVGDTLTLEEGQLAAKAAVLNSVSIMKEIGFDQIVRVVNLTGFVQAAPNFYEIPEVVNGASELLVKIFGEAGTHARSAVGVASLPMNAAVEIEMTLELRM